MLQLRVPWRIDQNYLIWARHRFCYFKAGVVCFFGVVWVLQGVVLGVQSPLIDLLNALFAFSFWIFYLDLGGCE